MGAVESSQLDGEGDEFPYFQMLQWATSDLPEQNVMRYDLEATRKLIDGIASDQEALLRTEEAECLILNCHDESDDEREVWEDWAETLLEQQECLRELRFKLVPRRLSEVEFWHKYFTRAKYLLISSIIVNIGSRCVLFCLLSA